jgi:hypothetical protein
VSLALAHDPISEAQPPEAETPAADQAAERPLRWTAGVLLVSALFLLVFNARSLSSWLAEREPTPALMQARAVAESWTAATAAAQLDRPHALIHDLWEQRKSGLSAGGGTDQR